MKKSTSPQNQFEKVTLANASALLSWIEKYYRYDHIAFHAEKIKSALTLLLQDDSYGFAYFVRYDENEVDKKVDKKVDIKDHARVGYFICTQGFDLEMGGKYALITDLYFEESSRRRGLGSATLAFIAAEAKKRNWHSIELQVEMDNEEAQAFYQKMGFRQLTRYSMSRNIDDH